MLKSMTFAMFLAATTVAGAGCKSNRSTAPAPGVSGSADSTAEGGEGGASPGRDGRVDIKAMRAGSVPGILTGGSGDPDGALAGDEDRAQRRADRMAKFDTDGDGMVSAEERDAARKARDAEILAKLDTDHDGVVSDKERLAGQEERAEALRVKLDTNGDGKLTVAEMQGSRYRQVDPGTLDTDRDGIISATELAAGMPERTHFNGIRPLPGAPGSNP